MRVLLESPFSGDVKRNIEYARKCMADSLRRGEYPMVSHLLYPQVLEDTDEKQRELGIKAGFSWGLAAEKTVVYEDLGISKGMERGIEDAFKNKRKIEFRRIL